MDYLTYFSLSRNLYKGNSIKHWSNKAIAYGNTIMDLWLIPEIAIYGDGKTSIIDAVKKALKERSK